MDADRPAPGPASGPDAIWEEAARNAFTGGRSYSGTGRSLTILVGALVAIASIVTGAVLVSQELTTTTKAVAPDVVFAEGDDYDAIESAGFATLVLGSDDTSATLTLSGVPGAASTVLGDVLALSNLDPSQGYDVTIVRSAAPPSTVDGLTFLIQTAADATVATYDVSAATSSTTFTIPASTTYDVTVTLIIDDGTSPGTLGTTVLSFDLEPT